MGKGPKQIFATVWINLEGIRLSKISQAEEDKYVLHGITYMWNLKKCLTHTNGVEWWLSGAVG